MGAEQTIERIKKLEEDGKKQIDAANAEKNEIIGKAREKAIVLVEEFEKTKDANIQEKVAMAERTIKKDAKKIIDRGEKDAEELRKKTAPRITEVSNKMFQIFKKILFS